MKYKMKIAVLLTVLFIVPFRITFAEAISDHQVDFWLDKRIVLQGMAQSWKQGYEPTITRDRMSLILPIRSDQAKGIIQSELILLDEEASPFRQQASPVETPRSESGIWEVNMTLLLMKGRRNGDYPCVIRIMGKDDSGESLRTDLPYTFHIHDGLPNTEISRIGINQVQADFRLGEQADITVTLSNPCRTVAFEQIGLRISDSTGEILPQYDEKLSLAALAPGESSTIRYPMTVLNKASVAPHVLQFHLDWTALGTAYSQTECFTLPVRQEIRLENGGIRMASSVVAGDSTTVSLPLMNMGKADIINTLATISLPGIIDRQSVLVGTIAPGETRQAQITFSPDKNISGEFEGVLSVEAADNDGNPTSFSIPLHLTVEAPVIEVSSDDNVMVSSLEKPQILIIYGLAGGYGLLLLLLLLQGIMLRRKIHRLEEEKL